MPRYKAIIEYDGTGYAGWQRQADQPSIQQSIEEAIVALSQERQVVFVAGRTDAGVHAVGQVIHFDINSNRFRERQIMDGLNFYLRDSGVVILSAEEVSEEFHARFSACERSYYYRIINRRPPLAIEKKRAWHVKQPLDVGAMQDAANLLIGQHDFSSFRDSECQAKSPIKTIIDITLVKEENAVIRLDISARSFLHHMVRNIMGTLKLVGAGKLTVEDVASILEGKDRRLAGPTAPAYGLYLKHVCYEAK